MQVSVSLVDHILNQFLCLYLPYLKTLLKQRHIVLLVLRCHLLIAILLNPLLPLLKPVLLTIITPVLLKIPKIALMRTLPLIELPVYGQIGLFEVLLLIALKRSRRVHQIVGCIELR